MGTITHLDFSKKREKTIEDNGYGPFAKLIPENLSKVTNMTSTGIDSILKFKNNKSQTYSFDSPDDKNWKLWEELYQDYVTNFITEALNQDSELYFDEKANNEIAQVSVFFLTFFKNLFYMSDEGIDIINNHQNQIKDDLVILKTQIFEYLSHFYDSQTEDNEDIELEEFEEYENPKLDLIGNQIKLLYKKRKHSIYRMLSEYYSFFLENLIKHEQVVSLIQASNYYSQKILDSQVRILTDEEDDFYEY
ncbi:MAG: hypothetical protein PHZ26_01790 [Candidatus Gracilibacteria bacterium]|nr:hypothetical protein [Candidatus Gracilibacteria bacterium]MDD2908466.1 hypothetical protein [Candidatus Gracilibacteria bacterium]